MRALAILCALVALLFAGPSVAQRSQATSPLTIYVDGASGNDANAGTSPGSGAKKRICAAIGALYIDWDLRYNSAFVKVAGGQAYNEQCFVGSQLTGMNLVQISSSNGQNFLWTHANTCLQFGDNAEIGIENVTFACNTSNAPGQAAIYLHNNAILDIVGAGIIFSGGGGNDTAVFCDGPCIFSMSDGARFQGRFGSVFSGDHHMSATVSGVISFAGSAFIDRMFRLASLSTMNTGATFDTGGLYSLGPSTVTGNSVLSLNGTSVPGGVTTSTGGLVCASRC